MEQSIQFLSGRFDNLHKEITRLESEIKELRNNVISLEEQDRMRRDAHIELEWHVNNVEFRSGRLNMEVHGITQRPNENLMELLNEVTHKLEVPHLAETDVVRMHRLAGITEQIPGIIIHFHDCTQGIHVLQKKQSEGP